MTHLASLGTTAAPKWDWLTHAACRGLGDEMFFAPDNERGRSLRQRETAAKTVCARCPAVEPCLTSAVDAGEMYGIWGGLTPAERLELQPTNHRSSRPVSGLAAR